MVAAITEPTQSPSVAGRLSEIQVQEILKEPNGRDVLLEFVRMDMIDPETAITAIENSVKTSIWKRVGQALLEALFSR